MLKSALHRNTLALIIGVLTMSFLLTRLYFNALPGFLPTFWQPQSSILQHFFISIGLFQLFWHPLVGKLLTAAAIIASSLLIARKHITLASIFLFLWFGLYILSFNALLGHFYHSLIAYFLLPLPLVCKNETSQKLAWEAVRYYFLYIMISAAIWKIGRGTAFSNEHFQEVYFRQHSFLWILEPRPRGQELSSLFNAFAVATVFQLSFAIGLFTKRFDFLLAIGFTVFVLINYLFMGITSWQLLPFLLAFFALGIKPIRLGRDKQHSGSQISAS